MKYEIVMHHSLKIALLFMLAFLGGVVAFAGARLWTRAQRTTSTIFETMTRDQNSANDEEGVGMCGNIDWVDKPFLLDRSTAAVIFTIGFGTMCWAALSMLEKENHHSAV